MCKLSTAAVALAITLISGAAFADGNSMSRWNGESYVAFEAARNSASTAPAASGSRQFNATPDNSLSRWNGDSYVAFEQARTSPATVTISIAEANKARAATNRDVPPRTAAGTRTTVNPFRNDTAA